MQTNNQEKFASSNDVKFYTEIELLKRDQAQLKDIFTKLDVSVEKIAEAATNISKILALHEQRVEIMADDIAFFRDSHAKYLADLDGIKKDFGKDIKDQEERISKLEGYKWFLVGIATVIGYIINNISTIADLTHK